MIFCYHIACFKYEFTVLQSLFFFENDPDCVMVNANMLAIRSAAFQFYNWFSILTFFLVYGLLLPLKGLLKWVRKYILCKHSYTCAFFGKPCGKQF